LSNIEPYLDMCQYQSMSPRTTLRPNNITNGLEFIYKISEKDAKGLRADLFTNNQLLCPDLNELLILLQEEGLNVTAIATKGDILDILYIEYQLNVELDDNRAQFFRRITNHLDFHYYGI
jgi:hypothetical protein